MADRFKQRLDLDFHCWLDELNKAYEGAYAEVAEYAPKLGAVEEISLVVVEWREGEAIHVGLFVRVRKEGEADAR